MRVGSKSEWSEMGEPGDAIKRKTKEKIENEGSRSNYYPLHIMKTIESLRCNQNRVEFLE